jgi:hypothetical protein
LLIIVTVTHAVNWYAGWGLVLAAFVSGGFIGLFFHRDDFWGGYGSFRRRIVRLGHVAFAALGMLNILYALSPWPDPARWSAPWAGGLWIVGAATMPSICFLTGWRACFRHAFFVPVGALIAAVTLTLIG